MSNSIYKTSNVPQSFSQPEISGSLKEDQANTFSNSASNNLAVNLPVDRPHSSNFPQENRFQKPNQHLQQNNVNCPSKDNYIQNINQYYIDTGDVSTMASNSQTFKSNDQLLTSPNTSNQYTSMLTAPSNTFSVLPMDINPNALSSSYKQRPIQEPQQLIHTGLQSISKSQQFLPEQESKITQNVLVNYTSMNKLVGQTDLNTNSAYTDSNPINHSFDEISVNRNKSLSFNKPYFQTPPVNQASVGSHPSIQPVSFDNSFSLPLVNQANQSLPTYAPPINNPQLSYALTTSTQSSGYSNSPLMNNFVSTNKNISIENNYNSVNRPPIATPLSSVSMNPTQNLPAFRSSIVGQYPMVSSNTVSTSYRVPNSLGPPMATRNSNFAPYSITDPNSTLNYPPINSSLYNPPVVRPNSNVCPTSFDQPMLKNNSNLHPSSLASNVGPPMFTQNLSQPMGLTGFNTSMASSNLALNPQAVHSVKNIENLADSKLLKIYAGGQYPQPPHSITSSLNSLNLQQSSNHSSVTNLDLLHEKNILPIIELTFPKPIINSKTPNSDPEIMCCTLNCMPSTNSLLQKSRLPLGLIIQPFKDIDNLRVIQSNVIVRCRSCRTYINPFVVFLDPSRWKCNICFKVNDLPNDFCYDQTLKTYIEPHSKSEIRFSTVEHIAPSDYMLRPPQPSVYIFLLDVSFNAIEIGYLEIFSQVLLSELDNLRGDSRTKIGFITYDSSITFYDLSEDLPQPHIYVCPDLEEVYLPCSEGLLVNVASCRNQVMRLLEQLGEMHSNINSTHSALSSALQAAYKLVSPTGGRITVFETQLPTIGSAPLANREDPSQRIGNNVSGLNAVTDFYKRFALECSAQQIAVDIFSLSSQYTDLSTIGCAAKFSGGSLYYFGGFHATANPIETQRFVGQFRRYLTRNIGFESVMRVRCTKGIGIRAFHGNCFVRSTDLLALPNVNADASFALHLLIDDNIESNFVAFQTALLYTSTKAERRIRVHTLCVPVTSNQTDLYPAVNQYAITALLARMAADMCLNQCLLDARDALVNSVVDMLRAYANCMNLSLSSNQLHAPHTLSLLPTYALALLKSTALRTNVSTKLDERVDALELMKNTPIRLLLLSIYPHLYPIHIWDKNFLVESEIKGVLVPPILPLSWMQIDKFGAYLLDVGCYLFIYLGTNVHQQFLNDLFAVQSIDQLNEGMIELPLLNTQISKKKKVPTATLG